jgi:hypothetical protein
MTESRPSGIELLVDAKLHAYDPAINLELFEGVLSRRVVAFLIDLFIIVVPVLLAALFIFLFGVVTLGPGWTLFWLLGPMSAIWVLVYYGTTMGGPASATIGMRTGDRSARNRQVGDAAHSRRTPWRAARRQSRHPHQGAVAGLPARNATCPKAGSAKARRIFSVHFSPLPLRRPHSREPIRRSQTVGYFISTPTNSNPSPPKALH